ncbi:MAG: hypothetical protein JW990_04155 [Thermoleophilia bacterium]|nr:hypothetical protein [Thermoleophilia bacterium]
MSPSALLEAAKAKGIHCLAVTDHNTVRGALEAVSLAEADITLPRVIPGIELTTADGEIIGLYIWQEIPSGLSLLESVTCIRGQGGLVYLPHPYALFRRGAISRSERTRAAELADIIEVVNGRALGPDAARKARRLARRAGKPAGAGSDAHHEAGVGMAYVTVEAYPSQDTLIELVEEGTIGHTLGARAYVANWGMQFRAPITRVRRRFNGELARG